ncbi:hypothetical protein Bpro_3757 [Polaromonas sp. JS666]|nr:hypothetical protein Bpro_3757 [Polaromonas sp. JS666]
MREPEARQPALLIDAKRLANGAKVMQDLADALAVNDLNALGNVSHEDAVTRVLLEQITYGIAQGGVAAAHVRPPPPGR